jgi:hypothetical protein
MFKREHVQQLNEKIALKVTNFVGSMTCAYIFCGLALYGLSGVDFHNPFQIVQWISQTFLQLVLLSVIMIGTNIVGEKAEKRAEEDHENIIAEFDEIKELHNDAHIQFEEIKDMHRDMHSLIVVLKDHMEFITDCVEEEKSS